jgi:alkanesulfonate monooxygenase SsuD/methylene tetrahydromethanopterin reductase-like flavin-dependent oxidoreductase (luciferase family)
MFFTSLGSPSLTSRFGVCSTTFATDCAMHPGDLAKACEDRGFESVWFPEHTHIPTSLRTPPPFGTKVPRYLYHLPICL